MVIKVLNKKRDRIPRGAAYVGRPGPFGNPFIVGRDGSRDEVIRKYENWFLGKIAYDSKFAQQVRELYGVPALVCWCAPEPCHAEVIAKFLEDIG